MPRKQIKLAPREIFEDILEYAVIPTFDLVVALPDGGVILVKRTIAPYANTWALPGLRMMKPESIEDTVERIAASELGVKVDAKHRVFLGQYVGRFRTEHERQDLSTGFLVEAKGANRPRPNPRHFSDMKTAYSIADVPTKTGAMYRYYLEQYFATR